MENQSTTIASIVAFLFMTACIGASSTQALAPGPSSSSSSLPPPSSPEDDCLTKLLNMSDCLSYVTEGNNVTVPDKACCPELAGLVDSNPLCLCLLLGKSDSFGIKIDLTRALKLPSVCRVTTPPVELCSDTGYFNEKSGISGNIPLGSFNVMFNFTENYMKIIRDERFMDSKSTSSAAPLKYKDKANPTVGKDQPPDLAAFVPFGSTVLPDLSEQASTLQRNHVSTNSNSKAAIGQFASADIGRILFVLIGLVSLMSNAYVVSIKLLNSCYVFLADAESHKAIQKCAECQGNID